MPGGNPRCRLVPTSDRFFPPESSVKKGWRSSLVLLDRWSAAPGSSRSGEGSRRQNLPLAMFKKKKAKLGGGEWQKGEMAALRSRVITLLHNNEKRASSIQLT